LSIAVLSVNIGVARECSGCTCILQGGEKIRRNLQGKFVSAPPGRKVHPGENLAYVYAK